MALRGLGWLVDVMADDLGRAYGFGNRNFAPGVVFLGLYLGTAIYDVATADDHACAYNRRSRKAGGTKLAVAPLLQRGESTLGTTATTTGLMLGGSF